MNFNVEEDKQNSFITYSTRIILVKRYTALLIEQNIESHPSFYFFLMVVLVVHKKCGLMPLPPLNWTMNIADKKEESSTITLRKVR